MISSWLDKRDLNNKFLSEFVYTFSSSGVIQHKDHLNEYIYKPCEVTYRFRPIPYQNNLTSDDNKILTLYKFSGTNKIIGEYNHIYVNKKTGISIKVTAGSFRFSLQIDENNSNINCRFTNIALRS